MILIRLHGYAVSARLEKSMHADVGNVCFWHGADTRAVTAAMREERTVYVKWKSQMKAS